jgi:hypothetical protein
VFGGWGCREWFWAVSRVSASVVLSMAMPGVATPPQQLLGRHGGQMHGGWSAPQPCNPCVVCAASCPRNVVLLFVLPALTQPRDAVPQAARGTIYKAGMREGWGHVAAAAASREAMGSSSSSSRRSSFGGGQGASKAACCCPTWQDRRQGAWGAFMGRRMVCQERESCSTGHCWQVYCVLYIWVPVWGAIVQHTGEFAGI